MRTAVDGRSRPCPLPARGAGPRPGDRHRRSPEVLVRDRWLPRGLEHIHAAQRQCPRRRRGLRARPEPPQHHHPGVPGGLLAHRAPAPGERELDAGQAQRRPGHPPGRHRVGRRGLSGGRRGDGHQRLGLHLRGLPLLPVQEREVRDRPRHRYRLRVDRCLPDRPGADRGRSVRGTDRHRGARARSPGTSAAFFYWWPGPALDGAGRLPLHRGGSRRRRCLHRRGSGLDHLVPVAKGRDRRPVLLHHLEYKRDLVVTELGGRLEYDGLQVLVSVAF